MTKDRTAKGKLRRFHVRFKRGFRGPQSSSNGSESLSAGNAGQPGRNIPDTQQTGTKNFQAEQPEVTADLDAIGSSTPAAASSESLASSPIEKTVDTSGWDKTWVEAYKKVKEDPKDSKLLAKLELFLEKGEELNDEDDDPAAADKPAQLKTIQKIAEEKLAAFEDARLSVTIGEKPIAVRESIIKAVEVVNSFKSLISGAVAVEPTAALAWAGISTALPILENIFQQDENAATGLTEITFLMTRYQKFHEAEFTSVLQSSSLSMDSRQQLDQVKDELIALYADIFIYEAHFILQYATRNKMHRGFRNAFNADEWKALLSEIQSKCRRIDAGVRGQIDAKTLEAWKKIESIEKSTSRIESLQQDTLKAVKDIDRRQLLQSLKVTGNAIFDSRQTSNMEVPCLPGTQLQILKTIQDWAEDPDDTMILWLEGMAGTGKTSVSMTVASSLKEEKAFTNQLEPPHKVFLGASFFFNQVDATRNSTVEFFTTIAWCLSAMSTDNGSPIIKAIRDNPGIEAKSPQEQFRKLIADPLAWLDKNTFLPFQLLVVIDALDECDDNDAEILLGMLQNLDNLSQVRLRLFITSRREEHISTSFRNLPSHLYRTVRLEKVKPSLGKDDDITYYLSKTLEGISTRYRVMDGGVRGSDIKTLAEKADGLFIYAVTACRFLDGPHYRSTKYRDKRLNLIFEDKDGPQQEVDSIYLKVLTFQDLENESDEYRDGFYPDISRLIGFIVVLLRPVSVQTLCNLLPVDNADLEVLLGYLHPILNVPDDSQVPVTLIHLSFRDFILDGRRSKSLPFSVNELEMHWDIFYRCLELMNCGLHQNMCCLELPGMFVSEIDSSQIDAHIPQYLRYACLHWVKHLRKMGSDALTQSLLQDDGVVHEFLRKKLLFWLEVLVFIGEASSIFPIIIELESLIDASENPCLLSLVHDAKVFVRGSRWIIEHAPMQIYCSALLFCSNKSEIRSHYKHLIPDWISTRPRIRESGNAGIFTLHGHTARISDVAFSPTEALIASASDDKTTRVWDYVTGSEQYRFQDPRGPTSVCFSMDGLRLAFSCYYGTICVRGLKTASDVTLSGLSRVVQVSFSPTVSHILAALYHDGTLCIWDLDDKQQLLAKHLLDAYPAGFVFSSDGQTIAVFSEKSCIAIIDVSQAKRMSGFEVSSEPLAIAFSIDSRILAVRRRESIDFWDVISLHPKLVKSYKGSQTNHSFLYLPADENLKLLRGPSGTIELLDRSTGALIGTFQRESETVSHDGALLADTTSQHPVVRIFSDSSVPSLEQEQQSAPDNVEFLDCGIALTCDRINVSKIYNVVDGCSQPLVTFVRIMRLSPDGNFVLLHLTEGNEFQVWNKDLAHPQATFKRLADLAFVPDTGHLVTLSLEGELQTLEWDAKTCSFELICGFKLECVVFATSPDPFYNKTRTLYLSPNGQEAIVVLREAHGWLYCQLWSFAKRKMMNALSFYHFRDVTFAPTNDLCSVAHDDSTSLFYLSNGDEVEDCDLEGQASLRFHPADLSFAVRSYFGNKITIWKGLPWIKKLHLKAAENLRVENLALSVKRIAALSSLIPSSGTGSIIDIWDVATGHKVYSHALGFPGFLDFFNFSTAENFLESNRGRIPLPVHSSSTDSPDHQWEGIHKCLYVTDEWVFQGHERLLWIPAEYRPRSNLKRNIDVCGGMIALAHKNNSVVFIGVALDRTPVAARYTKLNR